ncbi:hypothetical protein HpBGD53_10930 [Helicobacter pylori]
MFYLDWLELSEEDVQGQRENVDYHNELLQLDYSLANLSILKRFKEREEKNYQDHLNDEELQNNLREWRDQKHTGRNKPPRV